MGNTQSRQLVALATLTLTAILIIHYAGPTLNAPTALPHNADAIAVHAGNLERLKYGVTLYQQGLAPEVWYTGDTEQYSRHIEQAQEIAAEGGIPANRFHLLATTSTWEDGREIARLAKERGIERLIIVTDWPHSRRAFCVDRHHFRGSNITLFYTTPPDPPFGPDTWRQHPAGRRVVLRELGKIMLYWLYYGLNPWNC
jgi:hypothetical protein